MSRIPYPKRYYSFKLRNGVKLEVFWHYRFHKWTAWAEWMTKEGPKQAIGQADSKRLAVREFKSKFRAESGAHGGPI